MNHILKIDRDNFVATVEAGVPLSDLHAEVVHHGLYYPLHLGEMSATIAGTIASNAGETNTVQYGVTRHHVLGMEAALPNGDIVSTGSEYVSCILAQEPLKEP